MKCLFVIFLSIAAYADPDDDTTELYADNTTVIHHHKQDYVESLPKTPTVSEPVVIDKKACRHILPSDGKHTSECEKPRAHESSAASL